MSEIPDNPIFKEPLPPSKRSEKAPPAPAPAPSKEPIEDIVDIKGSGKNEKAGDQDKVKNWVQMLMEDKEPEVRKDRVEEVKQKLENGYEDEKQVIKQTARNILEEWGL